MAHEVGTIEEANELKEMEKKLKILFRIAVDIKAGILPETYSAKGAELANKYEGEELEEYAFEVY